MCYAGGLLEHNMKRCLTASFAALAVVCTLLAQAHETFKARLSPVAVDAQLVSVITGHGAVSAVLAGTKLTVNGTFDGMHSAATVTHLHQSKAMEGRGLVLTTTNKARLDEEVGKDSAAFEIVGKPYDLAQIKGSIDAALNRVREVEATSRR